MRSRRPFTPSTRVVSRNDAILRPFARRRPQQQPGILRFYAEETPGLKIGPTTVPRPRRFLLPFIHGRIDGVHPHATHAQVLVMSVMFVGFVVLLHIYGKLTAVPDAVDEDPIMPETPGADAP